MAIACLLFLELPEEVDESFVWLNFVCFFYSLRFLSLFFVFCLITDTHTYACARSHFNINGNSNRRKMRRGTAEELRGEQRSETWISDWLHAYVYRERNLKMNENCKRNKNNNQNIDWRFYFIVHAFDGSIDETERAGAGKASKCEPVRKCLRLHRH